jgi:hypothetical protein
MHILGFAANGEQKAADHGLGRIAARNTHRRLGRPHVEDRIVHFERSQRRCKAVGGREAAKDVDLFGAREQMVKSRKNAA